MIRTSANHRVRGFTLMELALVLGVIGIVLGGIWATSGSLMESNRAKQTVTDINTITSNLRYVYGTRAGFPSMTTGTEITGTLLGTNVFPVDLTNSLQAVGRNGQNRPTNAWGGSVAVYVMDYRTYRLSFYNVSNGACVRVATGVIGNMKNGSGPINMITNAGGTTTSLTSATLPTSQTISSACYSAGGGTQSQSDGGATTSIEFEYRLH